MGFHVRFKVGKHLTLLEVPCFCGFGAWQFARQVGKTEDASLVNTVAGLGNLATQLG